MTGSKFQYDESGTTFFYFLLAFEAIVLIPCTYYLYIRSSDKKGLRARIDKSLCHCENCCIKRSKLREGPWRRAKERLIKFLVMIGWVALFLTFYKCSQLQHDHVAYDPFAVLEIQPDATPSQIKKAYHKLSLVYHPDRNSGDEMKFMMIAKAYAALTDDEARKNWELYGNPDGPGATSFGIALPSWIVEKENSILVLGLYALIFMVALPIAVAVWWYRSATLNNDTVSIRTTKLFASFIAWSSTMIFRRVIMIIAASLEFTRHYNPQIVERPSDNEEMPQLIKQLSNFGEKNKTEPLCYPYSIKARALIHAHLSRIKLPAKTLEEDKQYVLKMLPSLIQEFIQCVAHLTTAALAGQIPRIPHLDTLENAMRLSPCIVQALWDTKSPFLQLPHVTEDILKHFSTRRRNIRSLRNLACMKGSDRRAVLRTLSDDEYDDLMNVLSKMPVVDLEMKSEVIDDDDACTITAGATVTVTVTLHRKDMSTLFENDDPIKPVNGIEDLSLETPADASPMHEKQKSMKGKKKKTKDSNKGRGLRKRVITPAAAPTEDKKTEPEPKSKESDKMDDESEKNDGGEFSAIQDDKNDASEPENSVDDEDVEWEKIQSIVNKKDKALAGKSKQSHTVHCPFFPLVKDEYWWLYIADRKLHILKTAPYLVTNLVSTVEVELKFTAPRKPGHYSYSLVLRSDSYIDFDVVKTIKLDVKEAKIIDVSKIQWDLSENEEEKDDQEEESAVEDSDLASDDSD